MTRNLSSEAEFLTLVNKHFPNRHPHMLLGRGDDCAELACPPQLCMTSDLFLEDVHFRTTYFSARDIGYKALAVNFSDLAAAGAKPVGWNMNLMLPKDIDCTYVDSLLAGMAELAGQYNAPLIGGDLSRADKIGICITAWGEPGAGKRFLRRANCRKGDAVFLGRIAPHGPGLARVGLLSLEAGDADNYPAARAAHLRPRPLLELGQYLADSNINALMDVSDGLARDLPRLLGHDQGMRLGADIRLKTVDLHAEVFAFAAARGLDPIQEAFLGGEDYLLLGSCGMYTMHSLINGGTDLTIIGIVTENPAIVVNGKPWDAVGFDHFA